MGDDTAYSGVRDPVESLSSRKKLTGGSSAAFAIQLNAANPKELPEGRRSTRVGPPNSQLQKHGVRLIELWPFARWAEEHWAHRLLTPHPAEYGTNSVGRKC